MRDSGGGGEGQRVAHLKPHSVSWSSGSPLPHRRHTLAPLTAFHSRPLFPQPPPSPALVGQSPSLKPQHTGPPFREAFANPLTYIALPPFAIWVCFCWAVCFPFTTLTIICHDGLICSPPHTHTHPFFFFLSASLEFKLQENSNYPKASPEPGP